MKFIPLTQGQYAIVDDADYDWLNQWKWHANWNGNTYYARRGVRVKPRGVRFVSMHRLITGCPDGMEVDHHNGDGIDNRRLNLSVCTHAQNQKNQHCRAEGEFTPEAILQRHEDLMFEEGLAAALRG